MTPPRFQFMISGMLWATFWVAVSAGALGLIARTENKVEWWWNLVGMAMVAGPFAAVGALFRRTSWGLIVGLGVVALLMVWQLATIIW